MDEKPWWQSMAIWGQIIAFMSFGAKFFGYAELSTDEQQTLTQNIVNVTTSATLVIGLIMGWWGRVRAKTPINKKRIL